MVQRAYGCALFNEVNRAIAVDEDQLSCILDALFPPDRRGELAKVAAAVALTRRIVISGGPGTGKTTTVAKLL